MSLAEIRNKEIEETNDVRKTKERKMKTKVCEEELRGGTFRVMQPKQEKMYVYEGRRKKKCWHCTREDSLRVF